MTYYIPGIIRYERRLLQDYSAGPRDKAIKKLLFQLEGYLAKVHSNLKSIGISQNQLSLKSLAALTTLEGIYHQSTGSSSRYTRVYGTIVNEVKQFPSYRKKNILLRISASSRLYHSLRLRSGKILMQISLASLALPDEYFSLLMKLLLSRLSAKPINQAWKTRLIQYENDFHNRQATPLMSAKKRLNPQGDYYNLSEIFQNLNRQYFRNGLDQPNIGWSLRKNRHRLGSYDSPQKKMMISKILDNRNVPSYVVEGIVYHEMLHQLHPIQKKNGRRIFHGKIFKINEKKFAEHLKLQSWLKEEYPTFLGNKKPSFKLKDLF
ncbi:MAG: hypothetical protein GQ561_03900 [Calditrichae bacterium]|nr:hypothetical protein [Calditrichia bacterium]